jgi:hypothetical protein
MKVMIASRKSPQTIAVIRPAVIGMMNGTA